jgi:hypothetical protein
MITHVQLLAILTVTLLIPCVAAAAVRFGRTRR